MLNKTCKFNAEFEKVNAGTGLVSFFSGSFVNEFPASVVAGGRQANSVMKRDRRQILVAGSSLVAGFHIYFKNSTNHLLVVGLVAAMM
jgi:hypothetical protein